MTDQKKVVVITGCSSGFGLLTVLELAKEYEVIATMRDLSKADSLKRALAKKHLNAHIHQCDVTDNKSINDLINTIETSFGRLDVLINNAGYAIGGFFEDLSDQETRDVMDTNFFGLQSITRAALPLLRQSKTAKIINMSSIAGVTGSPALSAYNASKWAVEGFSEALLFELQPFGIDVVLVQPGPFNTAIFHGNLKVAKKMTNKDSVYFKLSKALFNRLNKSLEKGLSDPSEVASLVYSIVKDDHPKFRYLIGKQAKIRAFLKRYLPFSWYKALVLKKLNQLWKEV